MFLTLLLLTILGLLPFGSILGQEPPTPRINEPAELAGRPTPIKQPSEALKQLFKIMPDNFNDADKLKVSKAAIDDLVRQYPDDPDIRASRIMISRCGLKSQDTTATLADINAAIKAIKAANTPTVPKSLYSLPELYALRAKVDYDNGNFSGAIEQLQTAILYDIPNAIDVFNTGEVAPQETSEPCKWDKPDLDSLIKRYPTDYRPYLYRGLSYAFFDRLRKEYSARAIADLTRAATINSRSAISYYFMGEVYYDDSSFLSLLPDAEKTEAQKRSTAAFDKAILIDPKFTPAYYMRASIFYELKQYRQAIKDYDRVIELDPENGPAFNDRALAKMELNDFYGAISDFDSAVEFKGKLNGIDMTYENRGDSYMKVGNYAAAIRDYTERIRSLVSNDIFLMDVAQIRRIYPEYKSLSDDTLCRKIQAMFFPSMKYEDVANELIVKNSKSGGFKDFVLPGVYVKRADAYLSTGRIREAIVEYQRAALGFPDFAPDRWHSFFRTSDSDIYIDSQTADFSNSNIPTFWIKVLRTSAKDKGSYTILNEAINCASKSINGLSMHDYNSQGNTTSSSEVESGWQSIVPDSLGERLFNGLCR